MRILVVDDEAVLHDRYAACLAAPFDANSAEWFDATAAEAPSTPELVHCHQGTDAVDAVGAALADNVPFQVAFIDVRMPPGIDGRETARRIRALDSEIHLVIVTGPGDGITAAKGCIPGPPDKILLLQKPLAVDVVQQTAAALGARWHADRDLAVTRAALAAQVVQLEEQCAELAANESRAMHLATHDSLTDALNRLAFQRALTARARIAGRFAIAMVDLDRFKLVNDTLGHLAGDALIRAVCGVLTRFAPHRATVARLGGDEFGILFDTPGDEAAVRACDRLLAACTTPIPVFGHSVQAGASAGIVVIDGGAECDPHEALRRADLALNAAKRAGKGVTRLFDESMDDSIRFRRRIEGGLARAIERGDLSLVYQPIVGRDRFDIAGFEALLRWNTDEYGPISPATFIPIAEESNLIHDLGDWVLARALEQVAKWPGQYVSINFSPRQFRRPGFVEHLVQATQHAGVSPRRLQIEITETAIFDDADRAARTLRELRRMGFRMALDDFGTGYSSLYNIRTFALDCLKIDRSFIDGMGRERESAAIVHSIIHLGRSLGLETVAEGVESAAQVQALRLAGASHLQGYFIAHPVEAALAVEMAAASPSTRGAKACDAAVRDEGQGWAMTALPAGLVAAAA